MTPFARYERQRPMRDAIWTTQYLRGAAEMEAVAAGIADRPTAVAGLELEERFVLVLFVRHGCDS